jgi:hypothetical protein
LDRRSTKKQLDYDKQRAAKRKKELEASKLGKGQSKENKDHEEFIDFLIFLNEYKQNICYDSKGVVQKIKHKGNPRTLEEADQMDALLKQHSADKLFPKA